jgi:hypothetical protein
LFHYRSIDIQADIIKTNDVDAFVTAYNADALC